MHETGQIDSHEGDNWTITMPMMVRSHRPRLRLSVGEGEGVAAAEAVPANT